MRYAFVTKKNPKILHTSCFWAMNDEMAKATTIIVEHNNSEIIRAIRVHERTKVQMLESHGENGELELPKIVDRWVFKGYEVNALRLARIKQKFINKSLKGLQGVNYEGMYLATR